MQAIYILRNQRELGKAVLPVRERLMCRIRRELSQDIATIIKPLPNSRQVALDHTRGGNDVERHSLPNGSVASAPNRRHARLCRDTGTREHDDSVSASEALPHCWRNVHWLC